MPNGTNKRREELRRRRLEEEGKALSPDRRATLLKVVFMTSLVALLAVAGLFLAIISGDGGSEAGDSSGGIEKMLEGIPQNGKTLGNPKAEVTIVEFGDLQCSACKQFAESVIPALIEGPVKGGDVNLQFLNLPVIPGEDSLVAARASLAASLQNRYWQFIEIFFSKQGTAGSGYVTDEFLRNIATEAGVPDLEQWEADRSDPRWDRDLTDTGTLAMELGFSQTPRVAIQKADGSLTPLEGSSLEEIESAIAASLEQGGLR